MQAYTYVSKGKFELREKPKPTLMQERDAIVKVTLASICSSDSAYQAWQRSAGSTRDHGWP